MTDKPKSEVDESTEYDNFMDQMNEEPDAPVLVDMLGEDPEEIFQKEWQKHWKGMPEFEQEENKPYKTIYVHFRTKEDYDEFAKLIDQNLSKKTKSIWHPHLERTANSLMRWIEEDDADES